MKKKIKLMKNEVFEQTMDNMKKRRDFMFFNSWSKKGLFVVRTSMWYKIDKLLATEKNTSYHEQTTLFRSIDIGNN